jgi:hypothetical protein
LRGLCCLPTMRCVLCWYTVPFGLLLASPPPLYTALLYCLYTTTLYLSSLLAFTASPSEDVYRLAPPRARRAKTPLPRCQAATPVAGHFAIPLSTHPGVCAAYAFTLFTDRLRWHSFLRNCCSEERRQRRRKEETAFLTGKRAATLQRAGAKHAFYPLPPLLRHRGARW